MKKKFLSLTIATIGLSFVSKEILPKIADQIYVLEKGKITAHGTHETLLKSKNFYSDFWEDLGTILKRK